MKQSHTISHQIAVQSFILSQYLWKKNYGVNAKCREKKYSNPKQKVRHTFFACYFISNVPNALFLVEYAVTANKLLLTYKYTVWIYEKFAKFLKQKLFMHLRNKKRILFLSIKTMSNDVFLLWQMDNV